MLLIISFSLWELRRALSLIELLLRDALVSWLSLFSHSSALFSVSCHLRFISLMQVHMTLNRDRFGSVNCHLNWKNSRLSAVPPIFLTLAFNFEDLHSTYPPSSISIQPRKICQSLFYARCSEPLVLRNVSVKGWGSNCPWWPQVCGYWPGLFSFFRYHLSKLLTSFPSFTEWSENPPFWKNSDMLCGAALKRNMNDIKESHQTSAAWFCGYGGCNRHPSWCRQHAGCTIAYQQFAFGEPYIFRLKYSLSSLCDPLSITNYVPIAAFLGLIALISNVSAATAPVTGLTKIWIQDPHSFFSPPCDLEVSSLRSFVQCRHWSHNVDSPRGSQWASNRVYSPKLEYPRDRCLFRSSEIWDRGSADSGFSNEVVCYCISSNITYANSFSYCLVSL